MSFWSELKRRNVFKVGAAYVIVAWLIVQVANTFFPILHLPEWAVTLVAVLVILGFPLALLFAWAFEMTPEGLKKTEHVPLEESITHVTGQKLNYILIGVIVLGVAYLLFDNFYLDKLAIQTEVESRVSELAPPTVDEAETLKTIAVLPFENLSSDPEQEYFVDGLSEELLNCLAKINGLKVTSRTSSFAYKDTDKTLKEVAGVLGVDHILEGSVRKAGDKLRITAQLIRVEDDSHLWSNTYDRELKDIFAVQEDIAIAVADGLKLTLGIGYSFKQLRGTDNEKAYEYYVFAQGMAYGSGPDTTFLENFTPALEYIDTAIKIDPDFARAWALKATIHTTMSSATPIELSDSLREDALYEAQKAVDLDPDLAEGYFSLGYAKFGKGDWIGAESDFNKAVELSDETMAHVKFQSTAVYYISVGYFKKADDILAEWLRSDPLNASRGLYIQTLACLGNHQQAEKEFKSAVELQGKHFGTNLSWILSTMRPGIKISVAPEKIDEPLGWFILLAEKNFESPEKGIIELRQLYQDEKDLPAVAYCFISLFAAYLGDSDFAVDNLEKAYDRDSTSMQFAWLPVMHEARQMSRFKEFVREIGLVDFWEKSGWPDLCEPTGDRDFVCN